MEASENAVERWRQYIDSYTLTHPTEGLPHRVEQPLLNRTLADISEDIGPDSFQHQSGLKFRVAIKNYRIFYTPGTEDYFHRIRSEEEDTELEAKEKTYYERAKGRLEAWIDKSANVDDEVPPAADGETVAEETMATAAAE